ncbi:S-layer protein [Fischerella thermalis CCMEE 5330]|uniref:S-layer protein n=1 Tax=Fischerella thermalis CCMEE 5330 TaxID=2019670 RepID=A0A2N6M9E2_9CYAN|nr:S-layer homology domain-containing protein [Fischerella thermalis]PMB43401.1 S-layer protein [Fischerella thermalis CCMEE 5330]
MTNTPPDPRSSQTNALDFDEFIGILVAFVTIGAILFWSFSRKESGWNFNSSLLPSPTPTTSPTPLAIPTPPDVGTRQTPSAPLQENLSRVTPSPTVNPNNLPQEQAPVPPLTSNRTPPLVIPEQKSTIPPPIAFTDVPSDFWARRFIDVLSSRNIIKGYEDYTFRPNQPVTRAEFAAIVEQAFGKELSKTKNTISFKDVPPAFWANSAIDQAVSTGFLKGYPNKVFRPQQKIPRVQVLVALTSGMNLNVPASQTRIISFYRDAKEIPNYANDKIAAATANSLVVNYPNPKVLNPNKEATRAEVAAMVYQALVRTGRLDAIQSEYIVKAPN